MYFLGNMHKSWVVATCEATFLLNVINYLHTDKLLWTCSVAIVKDFWTEISNISQSSEWIIQSRDNVCFVVHMHDLLPNKICIHHFYYLFWKFYPRDILKIHIKYMDGTIILSNHITSFFQKHRLKFDSIFYFLVIPFHFLWSYFYIPLSFSCSFVLMYSHSLRYTVCGWFVSEVMLSWQSAQWKTIL